MLCGAGRGGILQVSGSHRHQKGPQVHREASLRPLRLRRGGFSCRVGRFSCQVCRVFMSGRSGAMSGRSVFMSGRWVFMWCPAATRDFSALASLGCASTLLQGRSSSQCTTLTHAHTCAQPTRCLCLFLTPSLLPLTSLLLPPSLPGAPLRCHLPCALPPPRAFLTFPPPPGAARRRPVQGQEKGRVCNTRAGSQAGRGRVVAASAAWWPRTELWFCWSAGVKCKYKISGIGEGERRVAMHGNP